MENKTYTNEAFERAIKKQKDRRKKKKKIAYKYLIDRLFVDGKHKYPTYKEIGSHIKEETGEGCTKQNVQLILEQLEEEGYLIPIKFSGKQNLRLPAHWIEKGKGFRS